MEPGKIINNIIEVVDSEFGYVYPIYKLKENVIVITLSIKYDLMISCGQNFIAFFVSSRGEHPYIIATNLATSISRAVEVIESFVGKYSSPCKNI